MKPKLPEELRRRAHVAGSGELLWEADAAIDYVRWLAANEVLIVAVEAFGRVGVANGLFLGDWTAPAAAPGEPRRAQVERAAAAALDVVRQGRLTKGAPDAVVVRYFVAVADEATPV